MLWLSNALLISEIKDEVLQNMCIMHTYIHPTLKSRNINSIHGAIIPGVLHYDASDYIWLLPQVICV